MKLSNLNRRRERINLKLFQHKDKVLGVLPFTSMIVTMFAMGSVIHYFGFPQTARSIAIEYRILQLSFSFYVLKYFINFFYDFHPLKFLKNNKFEGVIMLILVLVFILTNIFKLNIIKQFLLIFGYPGLVHYSIIILHLYFFIIIFIEVAKGSSYIAKINIGPEALLTMSFCLLILGGAGLLSLPEMTTMHFIRFVDALHVSTSACCVTGLTVVDPGTFFTVKGQFIIMMLIQLGGLNIICFAAFFATFMKNPSGLKYQSLVKELFTTQTISDTRHMIRKIVFYSLAIELIGATLLAIFWFGNVDFHNFQQRLFFSIFHSVSAFNNAGFALFKDNLMQTQIKYSYGVHIIIANLIVFGGIGFMVLQELFGKGLILDLLRLKFKRMSIHTKVVINTTFVLITAGALVTFVLEYNKTLADHGLGGKIIESFFQSVTCRTAGFNTINISLVSQPVLLFFILLMFIGASPGSTGGGIKTTTFAVLYKAAIATIRGKKNVEM
jgi:Trk-type K+ transport system membrane component